MNILNFFLNFEQNNLINIPLFGHKDLYYSYDKKALRYETRNSERAASTYFVLDPLLFISDYTIGVQYAINKNLGNCSVRGIRDNDFGEDFEFENEAANSGLGAVMQLKSPENFLNLDINYVYAGTRQVNGILADKFIAKRETLGVEQVFDYAFSVVSQIK